MANFDQIGCSNFELKQIKSQNNLDLNFKTLNNAVRKNHFLQHNRVHNGDRAGQPMQVLPKTDQDLEAEETRRSSLDHDEEHKGGCS